MSSLDVSLESRLGGLVGTWRLERSENFEEYMKTVEVGFMMRKLGASAKPDVTIYAEKEEVVIKSTTTLTTHILKFKLGEEFNEVTADGRKPKTVIELKDGKLIQTQKGDGIIPSTITREIKDQNILICTCEAKGIISTRTYRRI